MPRPGINSPSKPFLPSRGRLWHLGWERPGQAHVRKSPAALRNKIYSHLPHIHKCPLGVSPNHDSSHTIPLRNSRERKPRFGNGPIVTIITSTSMLHQRDTGRSSLRPRFRKSLSLPLDVRDLADRGELELQHGIPSFMNVGPGAIALVVAETS
ncbi:hypothetical protein B9Z19DRAFT_1100704 [Tuber borchii]|uniref:Uncharacterized protein n=1 Tax=Tuber borchii TaxID=42251 RepID=A0A2T6ZVY8_TUBBO|nr:hypothetical protein B9Z19DRAFT_1100704 [Tuber borchii]